MIYCPPPKNKTRSLCQTLAKDTNTKHNIRAVPTVEK